MAETDVRRHRRNLKNGSTTVRKHTRSYDPAVPNYKPQERTPLSPTKGRDYAKELAFAESDGYRSGIEDFNRSKWEKLRTGAMGKDPSELNRAEEKALEEGYETVEEMYEDKNLGTYGPEDNWGRDKFGPSKNDEEFRKEFDEEWEKEMEEKENDLYSDLDELISRNEKERKDLEWEHEYAQEKIESQLRELRYLINLKGNVYFEARK